MQNFGEEMVGEYLKCCCECQFVEYNLSTREIQGEIDVIGLNLKEQEVYVCEVAIHLRTGLQYVNAKTARPHNVKKLTEKFSKDVDYVKVYLKEFKPKLMFWSPIVKDQKVGAKNNQMKDVKEVQRTINEKYGLEVELVINEKFQKCLEELKLFASKQTRELKSPVLRLIQIESTLKKHLKNKNVRPV